MASKKLDRFLASAKRAGIIQEEVKSSPDKLVINTIIDPDPKARKTLSAMDAGPAPEPVQQSLFSFASAPPAPREGPVSPRGYRYKRGGIEQVTSTRRMSLLTKIKRSAKRYGSEYARASLLASDFLPIPSLDEAGSLAWKKSGYDAAWRAQFLEEFNRSVSKIRGRSRVRVRGTR